VRQCHGILGDRKARAVDGAIRHSAMRPYKGPEVNSLCKCERR
jgi:hypothetical protein